MNESTQPLLDNLDLITAAVEADLLATGFVVRSDSAETEPKFPKELSKLPLEEVKTWYDRYLAFYEYLTEQIIQFSSQLAISEAKLTTLRALKSAELLRADKTRYSNAAFKEEALLCDNDINEAYSAALYNRMMLDAQEERRKCMSKTMDRIYREINLRTGDSRGIGPQDVHSKRFSLKGVQE